MDERTQRHLDTLLQEDGLSSDVLIRASRFIRNGNLDELTSLPLSPEEMTQAGRVLLQAPSNNFLSPSQAPLPTLSAAVRYRLRTIFEADGLNAEAALFVLSQDLKARAFNRALAQQDRNSVSPHP